MSKRFLLAIDLIVSFSQLEILTLALLEVYMTSGEIFCINKQKP